MFGQIVTDMFMQVLIECGRRLHHEESYVKYFHENLQMNGVRVTEANESNGNSCAASEGERWCGKCRTCSRRASDQLGLVRFGSMGKGYGSPIRGPESS